MTNEELKKKIVEVLEETEYEWTEQKNGYILQIFYDKFADALIAAGIGDVKETKFEADHYWNMWQGALVELERAEHRAKVAERALESACQDIISVIEFICEAEKTNRVVTVENFSSENVSAEAYLKRAEKELAKEGKDD